MKSHFPAYCKLSKDQVNEVFDNCIFIFDTNALLDLYRVPKDTAEKVLAVFESYKEHIRVPFHVSEEYCADLKSVITTQINKVKEASSKFDNFYRFIVEKRNQPHITPKTLSKLDQFKKAFEKELKEHERYLWDELRYGSINNSLIEILEGSLFPKLDAGKINEIETEGEERYKNDIPPGYKDKDKQYNKFGDLIIWKEILQYVSTEHKNIVFVTNDWKEDIMEVFNGIEYAPRQEMLVEFKQASCENVFLIMKLDQFLERVSNPEEEESGVGLSDVDFERLKSLMEDSKEVQVFDSTNINGIFSSHIGITPFTIGNYQVLNFDKDDSPFFKVWPKDKHLEIDEKIEKADDTNNELEGETDNTEKNE